MQIIDQYPANFKTHRTTAYWRVLMRGFTMSEENRSALDQLDRELFLELIESPIHPLLN